MKTSFYFLFWILIYPVLGLLNNSFINDNSFVVALILVILLSGILNKMMPDILAYDNALSKAIILEDIYTGNIKSFKKRITLSAIVETVSVVYFLCTVILIVLNSTIKDMDWVGVSFFGLFTFFTISRSITLFNAKSNLTKSQPLRLALKSQIAYTTLTIHLTMNTALQIRLRKFFLMKCRNTTMHSEYFHLLWLWLYLY